MNKARVNFLRFYHGDWREWQWEIKWQKAINAMFERGYDRLNRKAGDRNETYIDRRDCGSNDA